MNLKNKHVIILGAGKSGRDAAALAMREGANVAVHDSCDSITGITEGVQTVTQASHDTGTKSRCDLLVLSPGIDYETEFVRAYAANAGEVIGEVEFAYRFYTGQIVAITGTNGKTTTTELVERIFNHAGINCRACGNYGPTVSEMILMDNPPHVLALEVSSFQLETICDFHPGVVVWLNFSPDHMDRYSTVDAYKKAKMRVFENLTPNDRVIVRKGEDIGDQVAIVETFSTEASADYTLSGTTIEFRSDPVLDLSRTRLRGLHNAENVMAAFAACSVLGVCASTAEEALQDFAPPLHRCELVRTLDGVEYINDSKATNLHALDSALRSQGRPIVLIAGGKQKGLDYSNILKRVESTTKGIVVFGEIANEIAQTFEAISATVPCVAVTSLDEAVSVAANMAEFGDTILFSPGTSSFDMFSGYEERGDCFRRLTHDLK